MQPEPTTGGLPLGTVLLLVGALFVVAIVIVLIIIARRRPKEGSTLDARLSVLSTEILAPQHGLAPGSRARRTPTTDTTRTVPTTYSQPAIPPTPIPPTTGCPSRPYSRTAHRQAVPLEAALSAQGFQHHVACPTWTARPALDSPRVSVRTRNVGTC